MDNSVLCKVGYGLYVLTTHDDGKDNGCIINTVMQITCASPLVGVVSVNKQNLTHDMILKSRRYNVSILTTETPFDLFKRFGFQSGKAVDKFADCKDVARIENGVLYLTKHTNAYLSFEVTDTVDFGTHTLFKGNITGGEVLGEAESVTYSYYQQYIKPKPLATTPQNGYRCNICGYVYEGDVLPEGFTCPLCKHGASDFTKTIPNPKEIQVMTDLKGTKTEANLMEAFAGESQARNKYTYFASQAKKEGYEQIAALFLETAENEKEHAKIWFKLLHGDMVPSTPENLKAAASGEHAEWTDMYARMAKEAREEGFNRIAYLFEAVGKIEKEHESRYLSLLKSIEEKQVFKKTENKKWHCMNCGHIHEDTDAPGVCPVCNHPQSYFQILAENY